MPQPSHSQVIATIEAHGLIAVIRAPSAALAVDTCVALRTGGVLVQEIALTTPDGIDAIARASERLPDCLIGAGTVLTPEEADRAVDAGAAFIFAPNTDTRVIAAARKRGAAAVPGALTPTEIAAAHAAGADLVKLFPANYFGPRYIKDIHGPLPDVRITPTGGINLENLGDWLAAGAVAVGVGTSMIRRELVAAGRWDELSELAARYVSAVERARPAGAAAAT